MIDVGFLTNSGLILREKKKTKRFTVKKHAERKNILIQKINY